MFLGVSIVVLISFDKMDSNSGSFRVGTFGEVKRFVNLIGSVKTCGFNLFTLMVCLLIRFDVINSMTS